MASYIERENGSTNVQWGRLAAGASVVGGAVLLGVALSSGEIPILSQVYDGVSFVIQKAFEGLGEGVKAAFTASPEAAEQAASGSGFGIFKALGDISSSIGSFFGNNVQALAGGTLLAGGLGYMTMHYQDPQKQAIPAMAMAQSRLQNAEIGFAMREEMRAKQRLLEMRQQALGHSDGQQIG